MGKAVGYVSVFQRKRSTVSKRNTEMQHMAETVKRLAPFHARVIPTSKAIRPETGVSAAWRMAGKVMTARVT